MKVFKHSWGNESQQGMEALTIRTFWVRNGYELVLAEEDKWDEHVVKRWR